MLQRIIRLQLERIRKRVSANHKVPFTYDESVVDLVVSRCTETESGARAVDAILTHTVLPEISKEFLTRMVEGRPVSRVHVGRADAQFTYAFDESAGSAGDAAPAPAA
jgi:type VI secretion system protein VasG